MPERAQEAVPLRQLIHEIETELRNGVQPKDEAASPAPGPDRFGSRQYIIFESSDILMAISLADALEIGRHPRITPLPNLPGWILGVTNVRGDIISIVDLNAFFRISPPKILRNQRFIIIHNPEMKVGITVDRILGISPADQERDDVKALYKTSDRQDLGWTDYVSDVRFFKNGLLHVLDVQKILASPRMNAFDSQ